MRASRTPCSSAARPTLSRAQAALALLRGGRDEDDVEAAARELDADVVHVHNMLPLPGPRGLAAARVDGRRRGPAPPQPASLLRDRRGRPRRRPLLPLPPPQHAARALCSTAAARCPRRPSTRRRSPATSRPCSRRSTASWCRASYAAGQSALLGVPGDRLDVLPHYLPAEAFAEHSRADQGELRAGGVPPLAREGHRRGHRGRGVRRHPAAGGGRGTGRGRAVSARGPHGGARGVHRAVCERASLARELAGAAMVLMPSRYHEFAPYSALEAMAAGVPVVASAPRRPAGAARREALRARRRRRRAGRAA